MGPLITWVQILQHANVSSTPHADSNYRNVVIYLESSIQREIDAGRYEAIEDRKYKLRRFNPLLAEKVEIEVIVSIIPRQYNK